MTWPIEDIPNNHSVYYRVHQQFIRDGEVIPGAFREIGDGMSTDWAKYSTPQQSRNRAKKPDQNAIISFVVANLRDLHLEVVHTPSKDNQSHTSVKGVDIEIRVKLLDKFCWEIPLNK